MKIYVTTWAFTTGIKELEAREVIGTMAVVDGPPTRYFHGSNWHKTREAAVNQAKKLRDKRINSHRNSIEKLSKLKFE